jgi:hypothetical protein
MIHELPFGSGDRTCWAGSSHWSVSAGSRERYTDTGRPLTLTALCPGLLERLV